MIADDPATPGLVIEHGWQWGEFFAAFVATCIGYAIRWVQERRHARRRRL